MPVKRSTRFLILALVKRSRRLLGAGHSRTKSPPPSGPVDTPPKEKTTLPRGYSHRAGGAIRTAYRRWNLSGRSTIRIPMAERVTPPRTIYARVEGVASQDPRPDGIGVVVPFDFALDDELWATSRLGSACM